MHTLEGGCRCGAIRYTVSQSSLPRVYACHCRDCQTWSGSAFSLQFFAPEDALHLTGTPLLYERASPDGLRLSRQRGCPTCLTRLYNTNTARPGLVVIRAGTLDRSDELTIVAHIWAKRKMSGIDFAPEARVWDETPPLDEFMSVMRG